MNRSNGVDHGSLIIEARQPPSLLGIGTIEAIATEAILAGADPDDADGDGISGRVRWLNDDQVGRLGWKHNATVVISQMHYCKNRCHHSPKSI